MDIFVANQNNKSSTIKKENQSNDMNIFSSFCRDPKGVSFQTQKQGEVIHLFLRSHLITNLPWLIIAIFLIVIPIFVIALSPIFGINLFSSPAIARFAVIYILFYYLIVFSYIFISFLHWFYNIFIVTSERVVDIDYSDIVIHNIAVTKLSHVQDVNYTQTGFIPTLFNYGHLFVQTAGEERNFEAYSIPTPREATHIIAEFIGIKTHSASSG